MKVIVSNSVLAVDRHHCSNDPADVNWITSALSVLCRVFQRILGIVQDLKTDVHYEVLELAERSGGDAVRQRGTSQEELQNKAKRRKL